jgi:hypothetical protein
MPRVSDSPVLLALLCAPCVLCALAPSARADGAFPDEQNVIFPADKPHRIAVATNFGLVISDDDGATWRYVCESFVSAHSGNNVSLYQPGPGGALLAIYFSGLARTGDGACSWQQSRSARSVRDAFLDPLDGSFALVVTSSSGDQIAPSTDGGLTQGAPVYSTQNQIFGVEIALTSRPGWYATEYARPDDGGAASAWLLRSTDAGANWTRSAVPITGPTPALLLAVHPRDAKTVYLRLASPQGDSLVVTSDGGATFATLLALPVSFSSFLLASDGTLYVGTASGNLWTRSLLATTFTRRAGPLFRCLGERGGRLYACGDALKDGFNLGASDDGGKTWKPVLRFADIQGPLSCGEVPTACATDWAYLQKLLGAVTPSAGGGCHCRSFTESGPLALLALAASLARRARRQRLRRRRGVANVDGCASTT